MCSVFSGAPYFRNTKRKVPGVAKSSKGRYVYVWQYRPDLDDRRNQAPNAFLQDSRSWG